MTCREPAPDHLCASAAAAVFRCYYEAIDRGDFRRAYALWASDGRCAP